VRARSDRPRRPSALPAARGTLVATALALAAACGGGGSGPSEIPADQVLSADEVFVDPSRPTPPNNGVPGKSDRTLATRIWIAPQPLDAPACRAGRCALVLLAHGYGGNTGRFGTVGRGLAAAGYVVAAPAFPLTNDRAPGGHVSGLGDAVQQPADLSFVIDRLIALSEDGGLLDGRIDSERIGVVGHSLGGSTALGLTRRPCCRDARVVASAFVAPVTALVEAFFGGFPSPDGPPLLVVNGRGDPVVSPDVARELYDRTDPPHALVVLNGAGHADLVEDFGTAELLDPTIRVLRAFFDRHLGAREGAALDETLASLADAGHEVASE
jgi:alpha-beta hydrolase superfamily lysophospholipase